MKRQTCRCETDNKVFETLHIFCKIFITSLSFSIHGAKQTSKAIKAATEAAAAENPAI